MSRRPQDLSQYHGHHVVSGTELRTQFEEEPDSSERASRTWRRIRHGIAITLLVGLVVAGAATAWAVISGRLTLPQPASQPTVATCPAGKYDYLPPAKVTVNVLNATGRDGLANQIGGELKKRAFAVKNVGNERLAVGATAVVRGGFAGEAAAFTLQRNVPGSIYVRDGRADASVDLILGPAFKALADPKLVDQTPGPILCTVPTATPGAGG
ncbi:LytR C-terminal domain-containing protein [Sinomonas atrocyanea]|uniref:LytR C-terminal domain-containing protein n=1 Tax=Sinomonas atrocyanea TaxID=37927 RepID=UPI002786D107|nr:LytR C-terminal domain-containing protein [Sinomonas atrocyanea]MDQ0261549.1 hypothetical protein [Sinomonas atrocyanea]MDR6623249.1 hypothetical protein [Sinomonas atrocyanea]